MTPWLLPCDWWDLVSFRIAVPQSGYVTIISPFLPIFSGVFLLVFSLHAHFLLVISIMTVLFLLCLLMLFNCPQHTIKFDSSVLQSGSWRLKYFFGSVGFLACYLSHFEFLFENLSRFSLCQHGGQLYPKGEREGFFYTEREDYQIMNANDNLIPCFYKWKYI